MDSTAFGARDLDAPHHLGRALDFEAVRRLVGLLRWDVDPSASVIS
jgi:hypothetical protein